MRVYIRIIQSFIFLFCTSVFAQKENYRFINFGSKDGLEDKFFYNATQDKQGYMWFGSGNGLYRYDGHRFKKFRSPLDKSGDAIGNVLQALLVDNDGILWLGSFTSLQCYDPKKNIFWRPTIKDDSVKRLSSDYILNFSKGNYIWVSTSKNFFYRFNKTDSSFISFAKNYPVGASPSTINTVENKGYVYAIHREGIYQFHIDSRFVRKTEHPAGDITHCCFSDKENAIYLSSLGSGVLKFDIASGTLSAVAPEVTDLKKNNLLCIAKGDDGDFFIGGYPLHLLNSQSKTYLSFYAQQQKDEFTLNGNKIVGLFFDREKNLWLCSHFGLSMMPWQNNQIKNILLKDPKTGWSIEPLGVYKETGTNNALIVSSNASGLLYVSPSSRQVSVIENPIEKDSYRKRIISLVIAPDSSIYASDDVHFFRYNTTAKTLSPFVLKDQNNNPITNPVRNVFTGSGLIYIGTPDNGFYIWDYYKNKLSHFNKTDIFPGAKDNVMIPCLVDSKQNVWFTENDGISEYRKSDGRYYKHASSSDVPAPLVESKYIAEDRQHHYWITTLSNGLYEMYFENGKEKWNNYTVNSGIGLPSDYNVKIKTDPADGNLWINNSVGLLRFDPVQKRVLSVIGKQNGFAVDGSGYGFNLLNNNLLVQQLYSYASIIDLNSYKFNSAIPKVFFNTIKVMNEERLQQVNETAKLTLQHNQNFIQFEFATLVFNNANQNQYAYMLEGADKNWVYSGQVNTASYSGLKPGTYTFKVKAANNDGLWGDETVLKIIIRHPFYARWWFIALCGLAAGIIVYAWNRFKVGQAKKEEKLKASFQQQIAETEMKALRAQMNPHFIFNSLNSIQKYILKNEHFEASQYLTKFSRLIRLILDHSNQNTVLLSSELEMLKLYIEMESLRFDNKFDYAITAGDNLQPDMAEIPSMLIQPYVENAIWHGLLHKESKGKLTLSFSRNEANKLMVVVEDNGIGREKAAELKSKQVLKKKSYGMQITEDRIAIINRVQNIHATAEVIDLKGAEGNACGTRAVLNIPLKNLTV